MVEYRRIYRGEDQRLRAIFRILIPFLVFFGVVVAVSPLLQTLSLPDVLLNAPSNIVSLVALISAVTVASRIDHRSVSDYGFSLDRQWWLDFTAAVIAGALFATLVDLLWIGVGSASVRETISTGIATDTATLVVATLSILFAFTVVSLWEEFLFRGVIILNTVEWIRLHGGSPATAVGGALALSTIVFALPHGLAASAGFINPSFAILQSTFAGIYFAVAYLWTGSLAFPIGLHLVTNLWTVMVFGIVNSSEPTLIRLERESLLGIEVLFVLSVPFVAILCMILCWVYLTRGSISPQFAWNNVEPALFTESASESTTNN